MFALIRDFGASLILMTVAVIRHRKQFCPQLKHVWRLALIGTPPVQSIQRHAVPFSLINDNNVIYIYMQDSAVSGADNSLEQWLVP